MATACGHSGTSPLQVVIRAPSATTAAKSARLSVTVSGGPSGAVVLDGVIDFASKAVDMSSAPSAASKSQTILLGDAIFSLVPGKGAANGKPWLKVSRASLAPAVGGTDLAGLSQTSVDPIPVLADLQTSSRGTRVGRDTVRGVAVTHFRAILGPVSGATAGKADLWVDGQGRLRRIAEDSGPTAAVTTTTEFYDFGIPVHIVAPPADQVADLQTLPNPQSEPAG
jgi:hypothetical protein